MLFVGACAAKRGGEEQDAIDGLDEEFPWSIPAIPSPFRSGKEVLMWVDWFSIDQDDRQVKLAGVMSLIHYATLSTAMFIPCRDEAIEGGYHIAYALAQTAGLMCMGVANGDADLRMRRCHLAPLYARPIKAPEEGLNTALTATQRPAEALGRV